MTKFRANAARVLAPEACEVVARTAGQLMSARDLGAFSAALRQVRLP